MTVFHTRQRWAAFLLVYFTKSPVTAVLPLRHLCTTFSCLVEWKNTQLYQIIWRFLLYCNFIIPLNRANGGLESRRFNSDPFGRRTFLNYIAFTSIWSVQLQWNCDGEETKRIRRSPPLVEESDVFYFSTFIYSLMFVDANSINKYMSSLSEVEYNNLLSFVIPPQVKSGGLECEYLFDYTMLKLRSVDSSLDVNAFRNISN